MHEKLKKRFYLWLESIVPNIWVPSYFVFEVLVLEINSGFLEVESSSVDFSPPELVLLLSGLDHSLIHIRV